MVLQIPTAMISQLAETIYVRTSAIGVYQYAIDIVRAVIGIPYGVGACASTNGIRDGTARVFFFSVQYNKTTLL